MRVILRLRITRTRGHCYNSSDISPVVTIFACPRRRRPNTAADAERCLATDIPPKGDVRRSTKLADFFSANKIGQQKSVVCRAKIIPFYCPTRTRSILDDKVGHR